MDTERRTTYHHSPDHPVSGALAVRPDSETWYRSIWISDIHLGTRVCKARALLHFLRHHHSEHLYLNGDIVDGWNEGAYWHWDSMQSAVVREITARVRRGIRVVFIRGNHDEANLGLVEALFGPVRGANEVIHRTGDGRRLLVTHGHQFDGSLSGARWPSKIGSQAYSAALRITEWHHRERCRRDREASGFSGYLKSPFMNFVRYLTETKIDDRALYDAARRRRADGLVCGHTHQPEQKAIGPISYLNDGDWVKNCTALVEDHDGTLSVIQWNPEIGARSKVEPVLQAAT